MTAEIIDGKELATSIREDIRKECVQLKEDYITPGLAVVLVGDDPASRSYIKGKQKACETAGIHSELTEFPETIKEEELLAEIDRLNKDNHIDGILVQLPLPDHVSEQKVVECVDPDKDVDGFHPVNAGKLMIGEDAFIPCTPLGILKMVQSKNIGIDGKHVVVTGRSRIVGKPVGQLFLNKNATVTYCHSHTKNIKDITRQADILISAVGKAGFIGADHVSVGAVVVDVGMNRDAEGRLCGDVDFEIVKEIASYITPVPKGVGPMTITMLLHNTVQSAKRRLSNG